MAYEHPGPRDTRAVYFWSALALIWCLFVAIAWIAPPHEDDWQQLAWASGHDGSLVLGVLARARRTGDLIAPLLSLCRPVNLVLSPLVLCALLLGMVTHARGAWPDPRRRGEAFLLCAAPAALWLAAPSFGQVMAHRAYLASYVYGLTAMIWLVAAFRLGEDRGGAGRAVLAFAVGVLAGGSHRPVATVGAVALVLLLGERRRRGRPARAWTTSAMVGVGLGLVSTWIAPPRPDLGRLWITKIDGNLATLYDFVGQNGQIATLLALVLLALLVRAQRGGPPVPVPGAEALTSLRGFGLAWAGLAVLGLFDPMGTVPFKLAAAVALSVAGLVVVAALYEATPGDPWLRRGLWLLVAVPLVDVVVAGGASWWSAHAQADARLARLAAAPRGSVATIEPMSPVAGDFWVAAEPLWRASVREDVARRLYGLADIEFSRPFHDLEPSMHLVFDRAGWPRDLELARRDFRQATLPELRVENLDWPERNGRPVLVGRRGDRGPELPRARHGGPINNGRYWAELQSVPDPAATEVRFVSDGRSLPFTAEGARLRVSPPHAGWYFLVACAPGTCWLVDAFYARV